MKRVVLMCLFVLLLLVGGLSGCSAGEGGTLDSLLARTAEKVEKASSNARASASSVDFDALQAYNSDICAWLYVPGTHINAPVLQSAEGDTYYTDHAADGAENAGGALFTQARYNGKDFSDPVTVIYGQRHSGGLFSQLEHSYVEQGALEQYGEVIVYTPEGTLRYRVFGSSAYSKSHILSSNNRFSESGSVQAFLAELKHYHTMMHQFEEGVEVSDDDRVLILSTALSTDSDQRYLVLAILVDETG